jgi:hypothetical protein
MALWAVWEKRPGWLAVAVAGLGLVSMRGMMTAVALYMFSIFTSEEKFSLTLAFRKVLPFMPGGMLVAAFLFYHCQKTRWIGYHAESAWAPSYERVDATGFLKNLAVLGWRMLDFGRVFIWGGIISLAAFWKYGIRKTEYGIIGRKFRIPHSVFRIRPVLLFSLVFLALVPAQLFHKGLLAHRYLLPVFLPLTFLFFRLVFSGKGMQKPLHRNILTAIVLIGLVAGNCWVYPKKISMGWDSTLAHLPWYGLREQMIDFIEAKGINFEQVGTAFPNIGPTENIELNGMEEGFKEKDLRRDCYVFYSNVMNDFSDAEMDELEHRWQEMKRLETGGVCIILYKNPVCEN